MSKSSNGFKPRRSRKNKGMTKRVKRLERTVNTMKPEVKHFDTLHNNVPMDTTGSILSLINMPQAVAQGSRIGNSITLKRIQGSYKFTSGIAVDLQCVRLMVVKDFDPPAGGVPPLAGATGILSAAAVEQLLNSGNIDRFKILASRRYALEGVQGSGCQEALLTWNFSLHNAKQDYKGGAINDYINTCYYLVALGDVAAPSGTVVNGITRLFYTDA